MAKCDCYFQHGLKFLCYGTKEMEECSCGGDKSKCDFYPEKRQQKPKAKRQIVDVQEAKTFIDANWPNDPLLKQIVFNLLDKLPKVDAVEVVHGRFEEWWPPKHMILTGEDMLYWCSVCDAKYADVEGYRYCPHCGNPMDLEK